VVNVEHVEEMISDKTRALMIPSLIGNLPDMVRIREIANKHNLIFIEDSCDTLGARFAGEPSGVYSDISTTSFYASHIITAAGGCGMVCFHDAGLDERARVLSNWGRSSTLFGYYEASEDIEKRFKGQLDGDVYDAKFLFTEIGYNMQASELEGAFGLEQLKRLKVFTVQRQQVFGRIFNFFRDFEDWFQLPVQDPRLETNWLAFPLTIKEGAPFTRLEITKYLEEHKIQTRPVFTGNILKQPAFKSLKDKRVREGGYPVTDAVMRRGFVVGAHNGLKKEQLNYLEDILLTFLSRYC
jgi:CDP-6-deoxy-D-xylo-4-hexulose-3-dehydrase